MSRADLVVVGAGPVGLSTAFALVENGLSCVVVPASAVDRQPEVPQDVEVSAPAAGWMQPSLVNQLQVRSRRLWMDWMVRLAQETGVDLGYSRVGLLLVGGAADTAPESLEPGWEQVVPAHCEPRLSCAEIRGLFNPAFSQVRHKRLAHSLRLALRGRGTVIVDDQHVRAVDVTGNVAPGLWLSGGDYLQADAIILAAESDNDSLLFESGLDALELPLPQAHHLLFNPGSRLLKHVVCTDDLVLVPQPDGRLLAIDTDRADRYGGEDEALDMLLTRAANRLPALSRFDLQRHWLAPRPGHEGGRPMLGPHPHLRNLWVNAGHFRNGLDIAPAMAELLVEHLQGGPGFPELGVTVAAPE